MTTPDFEAQKPLFAIGVLVLATVGLLGCSGNSNKPSGNAPTVSSVSPNSGPAAGGTPVSIVGTGFVTDSTVTFNGVAATSVKYVSVTSLTAVTPANAAGAVPVVVTNPDKLSGSLNAAFTYGASGGTFTVAVSSTVPVAFFSTFGSTGTTASLSATRTPAGTLTGTWSGPASVSLQPSSTTATATPVSAADATIAFTDTSGPSGSSVLRSAPKFGPGIVVGGSYTINTCVDTTPTGTFTMPAGLLICNTSGIGLSNTQSAYSFDLTSTAGSGSTAVVNLAGLFSDARMAGTNQAIQGTPTISATGTFTLAGSVVAKLIRQTPLSQLDVNVDTTWNLNAATKDTLTGTSTVVLKPIGSNCGSNGATACSGDVTVTRTLATAAKQ